jgi:hypothetical protein
LDDPTEFGVEWQEDEPMQFESTSDAQFPEACRLPDDISNDTGRRLAETSITFEAAEAACANRDAADRDGCMNDVYGHW